MQESNASALQTGGAEQEGIPRGARPTSPSANAAHYRRLQEPYGSDHSFPRFDAACTARERLRLSPPSPLGDAHLPSGTRVYGMHQTPPPLDAHLSSSNCAHGMQPAPDDVHLLRIYQGQHRLEMQARPLQPASPSGWDYDSAVRSMDGPFQDISLSSPGGSVPLFDRNDPGFHPQRPGAALAPGLNVQSYETPSRPLVPHTQAQQAVPVSSNRDGSSHGSSRWPEDAAGELQVVRYGEKDPEKPLKRRDEPEDRQRKKKISKEKGACLNCKKVKKRCDGEKRCGRCCQKKLRCIRTCSSCWSNKRLVCDEEPCCQNCQRLSRVCVRRPARDTNPKHVHQLLLTDAPSPALRHASSSTQVNEHIMSETRGHPPAPTAWNFVFGLPQASQNNTEPFAWRAASDSAHLGSQPYSQQSTDDGHLPTSTDRSSQVASSRNWLPVPDTQAMLSDMVSDATDSTRHFDDAMHFAAQGSPSPKAVDAGSLDAEEDTP